MSMKFIYGEDWRQKIARQNRVARTVVERERRRLSPSETSPLTKEERSAVEAATRYERRMNMVEVFNGSLVRTPFHKSCQ